MKNASASTAHCHGVSTGACTPASPAAKYRWDAARWRKAGAHQFMILVQARVNAELFPRCATEVQESTAAERAQHQRRQERAAGRAEIRAAGGTQRRCRWRAFECRPTRVRANRRDGRPLLVVRRTKGKGQAQAIQLTSSATHATIGIASFVSRALRRWPDPVRGRTHEPCHTTRSR